MNSVFNEHILAEKLSKLNSTQQCIETLSHWCIFHRNKADLVATTWNKQFQTAETPQKVPLLYLANDILQNSKKKGNEFVIAFWNVLPSAIKDVSLNGDDRGKVTASRLVNIWEERRVFGSRLKSLKDVMLGEELPGPLEFGKKRPRTVKIVKSSSRSIKTKLTIGDPVEKIVSAFHLVTNDRSSEVEEMSNCKSSVHKIRKMEKDVEIALAKAKDPKRKILAKEMGDKESILKQSISKLKVVEANRVALISQLRETLLEQESELENVKTQIQVAQTQANEAGTMKKRLEDENYVEVADKKSAAEVAAEVADKLAASSSSEFIMSSVLSTFAAEEEKARVPGPGPVQPPVPPSYNTQPQYQYMNSYYYGGGAPPPPPLMPPPPMPPPPPPPPYVVGFNQQHQQPPGFQTGMVYYSHPPPPPQP